MSEKQLDLICIGRSCVDLYSDEFGSPLERAMSFRKSVGGSPMNIAIGTARLGLRVGAITGVGKEDNGRYLAWQLACEGVDTSHLKVDDKRLTAMVLLSIRGDNDFPLIQYRENCADMGLTPQDVDPAYLATARSVLVTGTHLSKPGVRETTLHVLREAKKLGLRRILDIDYRPNLWGLQGHDAGSSRWAEAAEHITTAFQEVLPYCDLVVGTEEEFHIAGGSTDSIAALRSVRARTGALLVFKLGDKGCAAFPSAIPDGFTDEVVYPGFPVKVYNSIGAGDGFMSGFLRGWLRDESLETCCCYANVAGAFAVSRLGCSSAYPSWEEMRYFLEHGSKEEWLRRDAVLEQLHWSTNRRRRWSNLTILAFDHRSLFEELAREFGKDAKAIQRCKSLICEAAFEAASQNGRDADTASIPGDGAALQVGVLVDDTYGLDVLLRSNSRADFWVGRSIERTGTNPLEFEGLSDVGMTLQSWPENHVVKCLFRPGRDDSSAVQQENERQLARLFSAVRGTGHELLLELIPQDAGDESCVDAWMRRIYALGVYPDYWKLPFTSRPAWDAAARLVREKDPYCQGLLVLGLDASEQDLCRTFSALPRSDCLGFAVGRSIFREPAADWFEGRSDDEALQSTVKERFIRLMRAWAKGEDL